MVANHLRRDVEHQRRLVAVGRRAVHLAADFPVKQQEVNRQRRRQLRLAVLARQHQQAGAVLPPPVAPLPKQLPHDARLPRAQVERLPRMRPFRMRQPVDVVQRALRLVLVNRRGYEWGDREVFGEWSVDRFTVRPVCDVVCQGFLFPAPLRHWTESLGIFAKFARAWERVWARVVPGLRLAPRCVARFAMTIATQSHTESFARNRFRLPQRHTSPTIAPSRQTCRLPRSALASHHTDTRHGSRSDASAIGVAAGVSVSCRWRVKSGRLSAARRCCRTRCRRCHPPGITLPPLLDA